jgi:hypothetical protein
MTGKCNYIPGDETTEWPKRTSTPSPFSSKGKQGRTQFAQMSWDLCYARAGAR